MKKFDNFTEWLIKWSLSRMGFSIPYGIRAFDYLNYLQKTGQINLEEKEK